MACQPYPQPALTSAIRLWTTRMALAFTDLRFSSAAALEGSSELRAAPAEKENKTAFGIRVEAIDLLRGLVMIIMALDHTRDFFSSASVDPGDPNHSWPLLFATRWITHLCAPGFIGLAGTSIYLQQQRKERQKGLRSFLVSRGIWLLLFDLLGWGFIVSFCIPPAITIGPLSAAGIPMVFLALLLPLGPRIIGTLGLVILALHNLLDPVQASSFGHLAIVWELLHQQTFFKLHEVLIVIGYPVLPWIGVLFIGYALGPQLKQPPQTRRKVLVTLGGLSLALFAVLRLCRGYGDSHKFVPGADLERSAMSFFDVVKYPPSLQYLLATGGILLLLFAWLDGMSTRGSFPRLRKWLSVYGRAAFFFYAVHFLLLHIAVVLLTAADHLDWRQWFIPFALINHHIPGWGFSLRGVYLAWIFVIFLMYWPCNWFVRLKARNRRWWFRYL